MGVRGIQCKAARALLGWSQKELAETAGVGLRRLVDFEGGERQLNLSSLLALEKVLSDQGVQLIDEPDFVGVKIRREKVPPPLTGREPRT